MIQGQQNWTYHHTEHSWPIVHAFMLKDKELDEYAVLKQKLQMLQNVEANNHLRGGIVNIINDTDTSWMTAMLKLGYKYACVWYEGTWPANTKFNYELADEIDRYNKEDPEWIVAGQISYTEGSYPWLARTFIIINLAKWVKYGKPSPHYAPAAHPGWLEDLENVDWEDSFYSIRRDPLWRFDDPPPADLKYQHSFGTPWIQYSLLRNLVVWGISDLVMHELTLARPIFGLEELEKGIQGKPYKASAVTRQSAKLIKEVFSPTSPIYFVNTEPSSPNVSNHLINSHFDQYVGATAGFKLLYYAYKYGFDKDTRFVWYDFDQDSVDFKTDTLAFWDGQDFPAWVDRWIAEHPGVNTRLHYLVKERWPIVVDQFGGDASWLEFWNKIRECEHTVMQADLIHGHDKLFAALDKRRTFLWGSNIYSYIIPKLMAGQFELEKSFINMIESLRATHEDSWYSGTDVNDADLMCPARVIFSATENTSIGLE
jgi:hypothetical protein